MISIVGAICGTFWLVHERRWMMPIPMGWNKVVCYHCEQGRSHYRCAGVLKEDGQFCGWVLCGECLRSGVVCGREEKHIKGGR